MVDSVLINPPVSSPLHPQLNLPLLKSHLAEQGFRSTIIDANIRFFHDFIAQDVHIPAIDECHANPMLLLQFYNDIEKRLFERSREYEGLQVSLRALGMKHDRIYFDSVLEQVGCPTSNPFISFFERLIDQDVAPIAPRIIGIGITFQDQIIPAFTLAAAIRRQLPQACIVLGGQIVTRCFPGMIGHAPLRRHFDYLALWDGEVPLANLHRRVLRGEEADTTNLIDAAAGDRAGDLKVRRRGAVLRSGDVPGPDLSDIPFDRYLFPDFLVPLQTTRGCYARCAFCAIPFGSNTYRVRAAERILDDIERIQRLTEARFGRKATYFKFMEDTSAPSVLHDLAVGIERRAIDAKWETFARLEKAFARPGFMEQLHRGGCRKIHWGLETNDPAILAGMNKRVPASCTDEVMHLAAAAGIMNFCFVLVGFPGETDEMREALQRYIIGNAAIHTLTISTFDLTRNSPMDEDFTSDNPYGLDCEKARDFQVRLPYTVNGEDDWKRKIVAAAHRMMIGIVRERPDIGFVTLFPDQIRGLFCDRHGPDWGRRFVARYGEDNVRDMLTNTEAYVKAYESKREIDIHALPEPLKREHLRTREDLALIAKAVLRRRDYEHRRIEQV